MASFVVGICFVLYALCGVGGFGKQFDLLKIEDFSEVDSEEWCCSLC